MEILHQNKKQFVTIQALSSLAITCMISYEEWDKKKLTIQEYT